MGPFLNFWCKCARSSFGGSISSANSWQWIASLVISIIIAAEWKRTITGNASVDALVIGLIAFVILLLLFIILRMLTGASDLYYREKKRADLAEDKLKPQLDIIFDANNQLFVHETYLDGDPQKKIKFVGVRPIATTPIPVRNCVGYLNAVFKLASDGVTWTPTSFAMSQTLEWSAIGHEKVDIGEDTIHILNVVTTAKSDPHLRPRVKIFLNKDVSLFANRKDVFRFDIVVMGDDAPTAKSSLRVALGDEWDDIRVELNV